MALHNIPVQLLFENYEEEVDNPEEEGMEEFQLSVPPSSKVSFDAPRGPSVPLTLSNMGGTPHGPKA